MKQKKKAGLTMVELLCALAVLLLVAACMVVGVSLAVRSYDRSLASSEAQVLCATLQTTVSDELRYSGTLFYDQTQQHQSGLLFPCSYSSQCGSIPDGRHSRASADPAAPRGKL